MAWTHSGKTLDARVGLNLRPCTVAAEAVWGSGAGRV